MKDKDVLFELGVAIGGVARMGGGWKRAELSDLPSAIRDDIGNEMVRLMREGNEPVYLWRK